jgi:membrane-bound lytic murein transglycosylase B
MPARARRLALAAVALSAVTAAALTGCSAVDKAIGCAQTAATVASDVQNLQDAISNAGDSPQAAVNALDQISSDLKAIDKDTGDADVSAAVKDLSKAVDNARTAADKGDVPDISPIVDAAGELTKVCTSG